MTDAQTSLAWPELPLTGWQDTRDTVHLWTQIVGKVRMAASVQSRSMRSPKKAALRRLLSTILA